jgi:hypothetical protein
MPTNSYSLDSKHNPKWEGLFLMALQPPFDSDFLQMLVPYSTTSNKNEVVHYMYKKVVFAI